MNKMKLCQLSAAIAALLLLTTTAVQATPATPTASLDVLWQWLFSQDAKIEPKTCPSFPECGPEHKPTAKPDTAK